MKTFTIGEIYRLGLLKNSEGVPYKDKATVSKELRSQPYVEVDTAFGPAKKYTLEVIDKVNSKRLLKK